ncbi:MAG: sigma-54 dependent transcriptional regulator [bacterium]|jgi:DNA-binding NtrC family response regulator|nr:sigma-54 dependent transcriptional regulator [bacterium]
MSTRNPYEMPTGLNVLIVDDEPDMITTLHDLLTGEGHRVDTANSGLEALSKMDQNTYELILTDLSMPQMDGVQLLREAKERQPETEVMIVTGYGTIHNAVEAMQLGALNYLIKPVEPQELLVSIQRLCQRGNGHPRAENRHSFHGLVGNSPGMRKIFTLIPKIARMHCSVLIQGESGVGKELVAQAIHTCSPHRNKRFVPIDCGALSDTLLESELFGHKQGSFTGSNSDRIGMIESAQGGTLLLDEVGNSSLYLQSRLLRVIEEKKVRRLGENTMIPVDVRILAATNADLEELIEKEKFREDLYYRLCGFVVEIPPLRERKEDIPLLAQFFLELNQDYYDTIPSVFTPEAMDCLLGYSWPGNVRELRTVIDRAVGLAQGNRIEKRDIFLTKTIDDEGLLQVNDPENLLSTPFYTAVETFEKQYLSSLLDLANGNISKASQLSGASRKTIREKGKKYGLM